MSRQILLPLAAIGLMAFTGCNLPLTIPVFQQPQTPIPEVEAKDLAPAAPIGYLWPHLRKEWVAAQLPAGNVRVKDRIQDISRPRDYAIEVPVGGTVKAQVVEGRKAYFRVRCVNALGVGRGPGFDQNRIRTGDPLATYWNPEKEPRTIYFTVIPLDKSMAGEAFTLEIIRGWMTGPPSPSGLKSGS
jgi:hypothetical protein